MREIEIKARLQDKQATLAKLKELGVTMGQPIKQHDEVFGQPGAKETVFESNWLRVRTENDSKVLFTLKKSVVGHLDSIEHEVTVDKADEMRAIITELGFEPYSDLTKTRSKGKLDDIEICVDSLDDLGNFIEAEVMLDPDADHDTAVARLWDLFTKLGIQKADEETEGYDVLERRQRGL